MKLTPYPKHKDSGIEWLGEVPEGWEVRRLKRIARLEYGSSLSEEAREEGSIPVYGSNGIVGEHSKSITDKPVIIIGRKGSYGKVSYSDVPCFPIDTTYYIDSSLTKENIRWFYYLLGSMALDEITFDTGVPGLSREFAYAKIVPVPSRNEQTTIANFLDHKTAKIDKLIKKNERLVELLKEKRQAVISHAVTKGLDPDVKMKDSGIEWLGEIPEGWGVKPLKTQTDFINGSAFKPEEWTDEGTPIIRIENLNGGDNFNYYAKEVDHRYHVYNGDLLFGWSGNRGTSFGPFIWTRDGRYFLNQHIFNLKKIKAHKMWFYWMLKAITKTIEEEAHGIIGMVHVTKGMLGGMKIPLPPLPEQQLIANFLDQKTVKIDKLIQKIHSQIEKLKEYRQTLISNVVTGKVMVGEDR